MFSCPRYHTACLAALPLKPKSGDEIRGTARPFALLFFIPIPECKRSPAEDK